jgi:hypothetical protein
MPVRVTGSGNTLEKTVIAVLQTKGFQVATYRDWKKAPEKFGKELLLKHAPYNSIYNHDGRTEFLLKSEKYQLEIRIECKWQQVNGSVDEKLPYLYLNAIEKMPEKHIVVIIDGQGWKRGAIEWLKEAALEKKYTDSTNCNKKIEILSLSEFMTWSNTVFRDANSNNV